MAANEVWKVNLLAWLLNYAWEKVPFANVEHFVYARQEEKCMLVMLFCFHSGVGVMTKWAKGTDIQYPAGFERATSTT